VRARARREAVGSRAGPGTVPLPVSNSLAARRRSPSDSEMTIRRVGQQGYGIDENCGCETAGGGGGGAITEILQLSHCQQEEVCRRRAASARPH
jgi:hypothetical protein